MEERVLRESTTPREALRTRLSKAQISPNLKEGKGDKGGETKIRTRTRMGKKVSTITRHKKMTSTVTSTNFSNNPACKMQLRTHSQSKMKSISSGSKRL